MNLQDIRKYYEYPVIDCCNLQGVEFRAENTLEPGGDAIHKFCLARLQFGEMAEQTIACGPLSNKRAVFIVEYHGPKGIGPADAQDFMECVLCKFHDLQGVVSINGPDFTSLDNRPYFFARVSFGLQIPGDLGGTVWSGGGDSIGDGGGSGSGGTGRVTTAEVDLTKPSTFAIAGDKGDVIPEAPPGATQEKANEWIVESLDALDEFLSPADGGNY